MAQLPTQPLDQSTGPYLSPNAPKCVHARSGAPHSYKRGPHAQPGSPESQRPYSSKSFDPSSRTDPHSGPQSSASSEATGAHPHNRRACHQGVLTTLPSQPDKKTERPWKADESRDPERHPEHPKDARQGHRRLQSLSSQEEGREHPNSSSEARPRPTTRLEQQEPELEEQLDDGEQQLDEQQHEQQRAAGEEKQGGCAEREAGGCHTSYIFAETSTASKPSACCTCASSCCPAQGEHCSMECHRGLRLHQEATWLQRLRGGLHGAGDRRAGPHAPPG